ncbi:imidazolonepropionase [Paracoccus albus]|uniref:imidazolonepropionase n=1 Tax=Paracoccus albus TaxID=3017784 RepID=UPI0022F00E7E|nr:imidazolonepropionase [Paracoccus albus]WBU60824.1 imidazolonepropionase [Paracoccus albus]
MKTLFKNARLATMHPDADGLGIIENGAILIDGGSIAQVGHAEDVATNADKVIDCEGRWITPAPIDCHTHLVYGGNRAREFEMRLAGASYEEIARSGGGIVSSVRDTRDAGEDALLAAALPRLDALIREGVGTVEVKSGYGLSVEAELKMLCVARKLGEERRVRIVTSYLGAHALPPEYKGRHDDYVTDVVLPGLEAAHSEGLVDAVDGFCEGIAFSPAQIARVFDKARELGLPVKLHAEQLSNLGGARLAAEYGALSADHLEYAALNDAQAMARAGSVAVMLPGAFYFLRETQKPPVDAFRQAGTAMAVATDSNPGTSPLTSLLLSMNMAATLFGLTVEECLLGTTRNAAKALGLSDTGTLAPGKRADLAIWNIETPAELVYRIGFNPLHRRIWNGEIT